MPLITPSFFLPSRKNRDFQLSRGRRHQRELSRTVNLTCFLIIVVFVGLLSLEGKGEGGPLPLLSLPVFQGILWTGRSFGFCLGTVSYFNHTNLSGFRLTRQVADWSVKNKIFKCCQLILNTLSTVLTLTSNPNPKIGKVINHVQ